MFADTALAARIERAACDFLRDCAGAIARRGAPVTALPIAGGLAVHTGDESPLNKVAGLGFEGVPTAAELDALERMFAGGGRVAGARNGAAATAKEKPPMAIPIQVEIATLAEAGIAALFTARGYRLVGFENVLGLRLPAERLGAAPAAAPDIEVAVSGAAELPIWIDAVATGFANPDHQGVASHESISREAMERVNADLAAAPSLVRYLARREGVPAGGASVHMVDGVCQLCGAATLPEHRRHGVQSAMLRRRLDDATRAGCDLAVVTTLPGSKSQQNVQRLGFDLLYTRAILVLG